MPPSATLMSASASATTTFLATEVSVIPSDGNYLDNYDYTFVDLFGYSYAPSNLSFTVQQAIDFGNYGRKYSRTREQDTYTYVLRLAHDGCRQSSTERRTYDCSTSCVSPNEVFGDMPTFANCIVYDLIAHELVNGNASNSFKTYASIYGITANSSITGQVRLTMQSCFDQCRAKGTCKASDSTSSHYDAPDGVNLTLQREFSGICTGVIAPVMTDIAGIGV